MSKHGRQFTSQGVNSPEFVKRTKKRRIKNKLAKSSRRSNRAA